MSFLETAETRAFDQSGESVPVSQDCWNMKQTQCEIDGENSLSILAGISSGPQALLGLSSESCLATRWEFMIKSEMEVYVE